MTRSPNTPSQRRAAAIYREAARLIESREVDDKKIGIRACWAIDQAAGKEDSRERRAYTRFMLYGCNVTSELYKDYEESPKAHDERVVALCLMAAIVERP